MSGQDPEEGTYPEALTEPEPRHGRRWSREATAWAVAAVLLLVIAGLGGLASAYVIASLRAAPPPDVALIPTPTPTPTVTPDATATLLPTATPTPTLSPSPPGPTDEPTPEPTPFEYAVQSGDSVSKIALRFGVTPESIIELNQLANPNRILPGQVLLIPGAPSASPSPT